jgi:hypothetical protein
VQRQKEGQAQTEVIIIDAEVLSQLDSLAQEVKKVLPGANGNVQINLARDPQMKPKVNLNLADVTEVKK